MKNYRSSCGASCLGVKVLNHYGCGYLGALNNNLEKAEVINDGDF
jgi:hypothetical protein